MKKVYVLVLIQLLVFGTVSYGAVSDDVYVRKDVFEAKMETMNGKLDMILEQLRELRDEQKAQRKDINSLSNRISELAGRIDGLDKRIDVVEKSVNSRIDGMEKSVNARIDGMEKSVNARIDGLDARVDDLRNDIYLGLVILGIIVSWPKVKKAAQELRKSAPSITLEDVKRLIEENNARLSGKSQV